MYRTSGLGSRMCRTNDLAELDTFGHGLLSKSTVPRKISSSTLAVSLRGKDTCHSTYCRGSPHRSSYQPPAHSFSSAFRAPVLRCPRDLRKPLPWPEEQGQPEVDDLQRWVPTLILKQHILRLQVPVHDPVFVARLHHLHNAAHEDGSPSLRVSWALRVEHVIEKVTAVTKLHDNMHKVAIFKWSFVTNYVGMLGQVFHDVCIMDPPVSSPCVRACTCRPSPLHPVSCPAKAFRVPTLRCFLPLAVAAPSSAFGPSGTFCEEYSHYCCSSSPLFHQTLPPNEMENGGSAIYKLLTRVASFYIFCQLFNLLVGSFCIFCQLLLFQLLHFLSACTFSSFYFPGIRMWYSGHTDVIPARYIGGQLLRMWYL